MAQDSQSSQRDQTREIPVAARAGRRRARAAPWTIAVAVLVFLASVADAQSKEYPTKSGIKQWVDPATPKDRFTYTSSRGREWELVMSDEFNTPNRSFRPGDDHIWTSLEKPDGVNQALELYSHNMTSTACDEDSGDCYFFIKIIDEVSSVRIFNQFKHPPVFENADFFYRAGMVQSWNKFCFQGGLFEVRVQLPGATSNESGNPDLLTGWHGRVWNRQYYPTWPGVWLLGNLGRAIFSASTSRMWPFSYDRCEPDILAPHNQRISACNDNPGYGLNPNQGRGAPEIDLIEGGAVLISSSIQLGPGMPGEFRLFPLDASEDGYADDPMCVYGGTCETPGANYLEVPTALYEKKRGHRSWYQGLRYGANNFCAVDTTEQQTYMQIAASLKKGVVNNTCTAATCPMSQDLNSDLGLVDGKGKWHWGVNENGTCHARINAYMGVFLCDPDTMDQRCEFPHNTSVVASNTMDPFTYQMDAISANWQAHVGAYMDFHTYRVEWVTGAAGYIRWMMEDQIIFEITSESVINVTQNANNSNPIKIMLEEPMYAIFNVALSKKWAVSPPNPGKACRGDGTDDETNRICDSFPMYMKIDYVRIYQDMGDDLPADNYMQVGCDPASHPTKGWIDGHIDEYVDADNPWVEVQGKAFCKKHDDCTVARVNSANLITGKCINHRCKCTQASWGGPRCTVALAESANTESLSQRVYGPPMELSIAMAAATAMATIATIVVVARAIQRERKPLVSDPKRTTVAVRGDASAREDSLKVISGRASTRRPSLDVDSKDLPLSYYSSNFV